MSEISDLMGYESPFGEDSLFKVPEWKVRLESYLKSNGIHEFVYSNTSTFDGHPVIIRIYGKLVNGYIVPQVYIKDNHDFVASNSNLEHIKDNPRFLVYFKDNQWQICDKNIDYRFVSPDVGQLITGGRKLNEDEYRQIFEQFQRCTQDRQDELKKKFDNFVQDINQQLANPFYRNLDIAANIQVLDAKGNVFKGLDTTVKTHYKNKQNRIKIQFFLREDGSMVVNHQFSEDYLKEFEGRWKTEAKARGMDVDVTAMRQDIISYLNSKEAEKTFGKKFLQEVRAWWDDSIGNYLEAIQATQKVTTHVWEYGTINRGLWHSRGDDAQEYQQWPEYMHMEPVLGGATDGVIDEIVGIPLACKSIYEIATDEEKRQAFAQVFTQEGVKQLYQGLKDQAQGIAEDPQRQEHLAGQTVISVASMFAGAGAVTKIGKIEELKDLATVAVKNSDEFITPSVTQKIDELRGLARHVETDKGIDELIKEFGSETFEGMLDDLIEVARNTEKKADFWKNARKFIIRGNKFNEAVRGLFPPKYDFFEVVIEHPTLKYLDGPNKGKPQRFRLDSYTHGEYIVSRKATDFDQIKPETFRSYLDEFLKKYPPGAKIKSTAKNNMIYDEILSGELIMEVPLSNKSSRRLKEFELIMKEEKYKLIKLVFEIE